MSVGKIETFCVSSGNWTSYMERLEMYFKVNKIAADMQLPTLIAVMGEEAYDLLSNLSSPKKPSELTLDVVTKLMSEHLEPKPSFMAERHKFRHRRQREGESIAQYVTELKKLAKFCEFGTTLEDNLRDQFTCCLNSELIKQRLFAESQLTYAKAVSLALSLESAERDAAMVVRTGASETDAGLGGGVANAAAGSVHSVRTVPFRPRGGKRFPGAGTKENFTRMTCKTCGKDNHTNQECRYKNFACSKCGRIGHLRRVCPEKGARPPTSSWSGQQRGVHHVEAALDSHDTTHDENEFEVDEELNHLSLNGYKPV
ncbi:uncharacterized protein LOC126368963 [Pectinophora gossypiella]|uniref:uncharacterized protein LOC126368963 n=2 Tax=Pectinophora gossypiella TaxID=13191 RepID=UPI00214F22E3|nr:uncharacterized protein LOC126368963 [Pectinophora gossypiella]